MLKSLTNLESSFQQTKFIVLGALVFAAGISIYALHMANQIVQQSQEQIYIFDEGSIIQARATSIGDNRPVEAREHVKKFHEYFFTLSPDEKAIKYTLERALVVSDGSVRKVYDNLVERGYFNELIAGNVTQNVRVDSVALDDSVYPYRVKCYGKLEIVRTSTITIRNLITQCTLRDVVRSENNAHGFFVENWSVVDNKDIRTINR
jgi:conjugative transposon TraK protein